MGFGNGGLDQLIFDMAEVESHGSMRATSGIDVNIQTNTVFGMKVVISA